MILGIDVSTSITGYCVLDADGEIIRTGAWDTRNKNKYKDVFEKARYINEGLCEIKAQYPIEKIFIEKPFMFFGSGGSSAKTMASLQKFNGIVSWMSYDIFAKKPEYLTAQQARKLNKISIIRGKDTKKQVIQWLLDNEPSFSVELTHKGNPKPKYYDIADAIVVAKAGLIGLKKSQN
jgi:Holliday junction resolvasome RuvABC endonuclease subunit